MKKEPKYKILSEVIGEGVHTGLRKFCQSDNSHIAWKAIRDMPAEEWTGVCDEVGRFIIQRRIV